MASDFNQINGVLIGVADIGELKKREEKLAKNKITVTIMFLIVNILDFFVVSYQWIITVIYFNKIDIRIKMINNQSLPTDSSRYPSFDGSKISLKQ